MTMGRVVAAVRSILRSSLDLGADHAFGVLCPVGVILLAACSGSDSTEEQVQDPSLGEVESTSGELTFSYCLAEFDDALMEATIPVDRDELRSKFEDCVSEGYDGSETDIRLAHCEGYYITEWDFEACEELFGPIGNTSMLNHLENRVSRVMDEGIDGELPAEG